MLNKGHKNHICLLGSYDKPMNDNIVDTVIVIPHHFLTKFHDINYPFKVVSNFSIVFISYIHLRSLYK